MLFAYLQLFYSAGVSVGGHNGGGAAAQVGGVDGIWGILSLARFFYALSIIDSF